MDSNDKLKNIVKYLSCVNKFNVQKGSKGLYEREEKELEDELNNITKKIDLGMVPKSVKSLVENVVPQSKEELEQWEEASNDILFPLKHSDMQSSVVKKVCNNFGVVVQGAPGTGKTQTIVNLICHFVSHNKRILVTGPNSNVLNKLVKRIPYYIKSLCINFNESDEKKLEHLNSNVKKITENLALDLDELETEIKELKTNLVNCKKKQDELCCDLEREEKIQNGSIKFHGKCYKLLNIAKWVKANENKYSWIEDNISLMEMCPITDAKFSRLIYLLSNANKDEIIKFPRIESLIFNLPSYSELISKIERFMQLKKEYPTYKNALRDWCISYNVEYDYSKILNRLDEAQRFLEKIQGTWMENIVKCARKSETVKIVIEETIIKCNFYIKKIFSIVKEINSSYIEIPNDISIVALTQKFGAIYKQYEEKGKINKIFKVLHPECESILQKCTIDNKSIKNKEQAKKVMKYIEKRYIEQCLRKLWNNSINVYGGEKIGKIDLNVLANLENTINKIDILIKWDKLVKNKISVCMKNIALLNEIDWYKKDSYKYLKKGVLSIKYTNEFKDLKIYILKLERTISQIDGFEDIVQAIYNEDIRKLKRTYKRLDKVREMAPKLKEINVLLKKINNVCPMLTEKILTDEDKMNMLLKYKNFSKAWKWKQFDYILSKVHEVEINDIEDRLSCEKNKEVKIIEKILAKKACYNEMKRLKESEKRSLYAWMDIVSKIGKGRGKNCEEYKKVQNKEVEICEDVIPVWIMSLNKIIKKLPHCKELFDLVIIEEGNQCNIFGISALMRAKKAIVFGDSNEIGTETIGVNVDNIQKLIGKYLKDIPHSQCFDMQTSLYNTALRIFQSKVVLKEEFRCAQEIIGFSKETCYSNEDIISLSKFNCDKKIGFPIKSVKVDGKRHKLKPINVEEAKAIVNEIANCCKDPRYKGMTMGVISLLGNYQAELIESLLKEKIGTKEIEEREIVCGNAASYQGDERNIIFLSMVIGNNVKFNALTKKSDIARFNVAMSRAKNAVFLFHSVDLKDLNPMCIRSKLLKYFIDSNKNRNINLKNIFESQLQKDVYKMIKSKGYEVKPEILVGDYKIDFVIDGMKDKIAIQCNGDNVDKINNWKEEHKKQNCLEKVGWKFFKINGSEFYRNPEKTIDKLFEKIKILDKNKGIA